jgi:elongation factor G
MGQTATSNLRTVALVGHGAAGKTTLAESLLAAAGAISSRGAVEKGSTVCDFDPQEKEFGHSLNAALASFSWQGVQVHLIDTPGFPDFAGSGDRCARGCGHGLVVINAQNGIELSSERMMKLAAARGVCRMIVINKIDAENVNLPALVGEIRERFGRECMLLDLPARQASEVVEVLGHDDGESDFESVAAAHRALIDQIVEEDEDLLARYLDEGVDPSPDELHLPFEKGAARRPPDSDSLSFRPRPAPASRSCSTSSPGWRPIRPKATRRPSIAASPAGMEAFRAEPDPCKHVLAHVFKVVSDPFIGKVGVFRVHQGTIRKDSQLFVGDGKRPFKVGHIYRLQGKEYVEVETLLPVTWAPLPRSRKSSSTAFCTTRMTKIIST